MQKNNPIKGLIRYSLYSGSGHIIIYGVIFLVLGIVLLIFGSAPVFPVLAVAQFAPVGLMCIAADDKSNWARFQLTTPIKRNQVIISRYIVYLIFMLIGLTASVIFTGLGVVLDRLGIVEYWGFPIGVIAQLLQGFDPIKITIIMTISGIGTALIVCSLFYPLAYTIFKGKEEGLAFITTMLSVAILWLIAWIGIGFELPLYGFALFCLTVPAILLIISGIITAKIYEKVDV